jgi:hypothetical protein
MSLFSDCWSQNKKKFSLSDYIETYEGISIQEMKRSGIPASITLAQGIIESQNGNSTLARDANNHFGIKCHDWTGEKVYQDDDSKGECFRKYKSAKDSYQDHTDFLLNKNRYAFLFKYSSTDYKSWAYGLKSAGYATDKIYAERLIKVIEDNQLYLLDKEISIARNITERKKPHASNEFSVDVDPHRVYIRNRIEYVLAKPGDTFNKLAEELGMMRWELPKYNDLTDDSIIKAGQVLYIQPKRWRAEKGMDSYISKPGDSMHDISQMYGVKLRRLYRKNRMEPGQQPVAGQKIYLRKRRPRSEM